MKAELVLPRAGDDFTADTEPVCELVEFDVVDGDGNPHVFAFAAGIAHLVVVALDSPGRIARHAVARLQDVLEMPEIVDALGDDRQPLASAFDLLTVFNLHARPFSRWG